ncbi:hypothetical protein BC830DRAFT_1143268 [Chytriomyces sp. MP71]|nr:hypothetical protein BC830DRAFT_1143268 [Chytriomyces sp. MP71]
MFKQTRLRAMPLVTAMVAFAAAHGDPCNNRLDAGRRRRGQGWRDCASTSSSELAPSSATATEPSTSTLSTADPRLSTSIESVIAVAETMGADESLSEDKSGWTPSESEWNYANEDETSTSSSSTEPSYPTYEASLQTRGSTTSLRQAPSTLTFETFTNANANAKAQVTNATLSSSNVAAIAGGACAAALLAGVALIAFLVLAARRGRRIRLQMEKEKGIVRKDEGGALSWTSSRDGFSDGDSENAFLASTLPLTEEQL